MLGIALSETVGTGKAEKGKLYANVTVMGINGDYFLSNAPPCCPGACSPPMSSGIAG